MNDEGDAVPGWVWVRETWSVAGFFAVEDVAFNMGVVTAAIREVPPEVARQIVR